MATETLRPEDRRVFERFKVSLYLKYCLLSCRGQGEAFACDISANGIGLVSKKRLRPRAHLAMLLNIPAQAQPVYIRGRVVWSKIAGFNKYKAGINLEKPDLMGLSRILAAQAAA